MYATDRLDYEPTVVARLEVEHDDRCMLRYTAGLGQPESPEMTLNFFDFTPASVHPGLPYPSDAALVLDLSDMAAVFDSLAPNHVYMSVRDLDHMDNRSGTFECAWLEDTATALYAIFPNAPLPIPDENETVTTNVEVDYSLPSPEDLLIELDSSQGLVELTWQPPSEAGLILGYYVYRNGIRIDSTRSASYSDHLVGAGTHSYAISARFPAGESFQIPGAVFGGGNAYGLPYADDFEAGLGGWFQAGNCGLDAAITSEPVHTGEYAMVARTVGLGNTFVVRPADAVQGIAIRAWFNVSASPNIDGGFSAGVGWLNPGGGMSGVFIAPNGTPSYTYPYAGDQEVFPFDSTFVAEQGDWYQQRIQYLDGLLHATILDTSWNVLMNQAVAVEDYDAVGLAMGAGALEDGASYFDDLAAYEWSGTDVNNFYPPEGGASPYALVVTDVTADGNSLTQGDELGVFDGTDCVGAAVIDGQWPLILHGWAATDTTSGYIDGNPILFRIWIGEENRFFAGDAVFEIGGTFGDGLFSRVSLEAGGEVDVDEIVKVDPGVYSLSPARPSPFSAATSIELSLPQAMWVRVAAYDTSGREIKSLGEGWYERGAHLLRLDGDGLASGVYLIRAESAQKRIASQTVVLLR
jgi:hypothetical protein